MMIWPRGFPSLALESRELRIAANMETISVSHQRETLSGIPGGSGCGLNAEAVLTPPRPVEATTAIRTAITTNAFFNLILPKIYVLRLTPPGNDIVSGANLSHLRTIFHERFVNASDDSVVEPNAPVGKFAHATPATNARNRHRPE